MDRLTAPLIAVALLLTLLMPTSSMLLLAPRQEATGTTTEDELKLEKVSVLSGRTAELPCDITPPPLDSLYLVLWYRNDSDFPIYKYDARRSRENYRQQQTQHDSQMLLLQQQQELYSSSSSSSSQQLSPLTRVNFQFDSHPALLLLNNVVDGDEGVYRCRVDFGRSPTRNVLVQLTVVVPPQKIRIIEDNRQVSSVIGPYDEGGQLSLNCIVSGGRPRPEVSWWLDDKLVDHTYIATSENVVQNVLIIQPLERRHLHAILRCQASNYFGVHNNTPPYPMTAYGLHQQQQQLPSQHHYRQQQQQQQQQQHTIVSSVQLDLNLRPVWVTISGAEKPLSAGKSYTIECAAGGSRPSANIHWYLHSVQQPAKERVTMDGSNTTSSLRLVPTADDHDAELICSAVNPLLGVANTTNVGNGIETRRKLVVHFAPLTDLELGRNLKPDSIVEGNDVYFECRIRSNPAPHRVVWTHEGLSIKENASAGVIIVEQSLVIRRVSRNHSGRYSCTAVNSEGTGTSNVVQLRVMFQPVCRPGQKIIYGVGKQETVNVRCQTDAIPPAHSYRWAFNASTSEMTELHPHPLPATTIQTEDGLEVDGSSVISYSPQSERDYGSLVCWARNEIGEQREPCVYRIFLGVRPDPPSNCSVINQTADAVEVWCRPGFDGGHPQQFQFEIFDTQSAVLLYNKSGRYPHLRVGNLDSGIKLFIQISAFNQRGRSALVPLEAYTVKIADKQTVIMETTDLGSVLGIASGVSASVLMICIAIGLTARFRHQNHHSRHHHAGHRDDLVADKAKTDLVDHPPHDTDDPDVIINGNTSSSVQESTRHYSRVESTATSTLMQKETDRYGRPTSTDNYNVQSSWNHRGSEDSAAIVPSQQYYHGALGRPAAAAGQPWMAVDRATVNGHHASAAGTIEIVTVKTPHRQKQVPETSI